MRSRPKSAFEYQHRSYKKHKMSQDVMSRTTKRFSFFMTEHKALTNKQRTISSRCVSSFFKRTSIPTSSHCFLSPNDIGELYLAKCKDLKIQRLADQRRNFYNYCYHHCRNNSINFRDVLNIITHRQD